MWLEEHNELLSYKASLSAATIGQGLLADRYGLRDVEAGPCYTEPVFHRYPRLGFTQS